MKRFNIILLTIVMAAGLVYTDMAQAGRIKTRQTNQEERISDGIESGELNQKEALKLQQEQNQIRKFKHNARSDGKLTVKERDKIENMQDRASKRIFRAKHNQVKAQGQD